MKSVESRNGAIGGLDAASTAALLSAAADVALVLDADGVVLDVILGSEEVAKEGYSKWIGQPWIETVTPESRARIEALLADADNPPGDHKWRHVTHTSSRGADVPVLYSTVRLEAQKRIVAFGRDLRDMAKLQQRLVDAQQAMERDYWRLRNIETRYRLMFQMSSEAVLIVDDAERIVEANPAAAELLGESSKRVLGKSLVECFGAGGAQAIQLMIASVRGAGRADDVSIRLGADRREFLASAFYFRQGNEGLYLLRIAAPGAEAAASNLPKIVMRAFENAVDAFVVTDLDGRIIAANRSFLDLAQMPAEVQARGEPLDRWIGRSRVDFSVLIANLRQHGTIRLFVTTLTGEHGASADVEVSAITIPASDPPSMAFNIRNVGRRASTEPDSSGDLPRSVEQLTELVGRVPLKELVRDATDLVEKLCIQAALQLTQDNRASAAEVLGVSRQNLYVKLRRYGLIDAGAEPEPPASS